MQRPRRACWPGRSPKACPGSALFTRSRKILRRHAELVGLQVQFHHSRHRRSDPPAETGARRPRISTTNDGPPRALAASDRRWKNRGLDARPMCRRARRPPSRNGKGGELYALYQERLKTLNAVRFRRSSARMSASCYATTRSSGAISGSFQIYSSRRISGHQCRPVSVAAPAGAGAARTSAASATTTNRSMAGAAPRSTTFCASRRISRAQRLFVLSSNYRSTGHILGVAAGLIAHNEGRLGKTLCTDDEAGDKPTVARRLGFRGGSAQRRRGDRAAAARRACRSTSSPFWSAPRFRCANSRSASSLSACPTASSAARAFTSAPEIRDALAYLRMHRPAGGRSRLRAHLQCAEARPRRGHACSFCTIMRAPRSACR